MKVNINTQDKQYKSPSKSEIAGGVIAGWGVKNLIRVPHQLASLKIIRHMKNISSSLSADEFSQIEKAFSDTINKSGLAEKGVSIIKNTAENRDEIEKILHTEIDKGILKYLPEQVKKGISNVFSSQLTTGNNAMYTFKSKKIIMPEKDLGLALFHEAGHAMNANLSKLGKMLQKCRASAVLTIPITFIALFKTKKAPNEKPANAFDKTTTFVKENAGKLTFAAFLPMLFEEGLATIKGNKFAKQFLNPNLAKKAAKTNALGFTTYLLLAALSSLGIYAGTTLKDTIAQPKPFQ